MVTHVNALRRYRIDTLSANGRLYLASDVNLTTPLVAGAVVNASNSTGFVQLQYLPNPNYYNMYKADLDPEEVGFAAAPTRNTRDMFSRPLFGCSNPQGCPDTFNYSLGYDEFSNNQPLFGMTRVTSYTH